MSGPSSSRFREREGLLTGDSPTAYAVASYAASLLCTEKKPQSVAGGGGPVTEGTIRNRDEEQIDVAPVTAGRQRRHPPNPFDRNRGHHAYALSSCTWSAEASV